MTNLTRVGKWLVVALIAALPLLLHNGYVTTMALQIGIHAIIAVGLGLLLGYAGQISLGHAAFFGLGAYSSAILTTRCHWPPLAALLAGIVVTGVIAVILGAPALRLHGHHLAMFTLGLGIIVHIILEQAKGLTNGFDGIAGIPGLQFGRFELTTDADYYVLVLVVLAATLVLAANLVDSRPGRALRALHESESAAAACGVDVARAKLEVFVLSALLASLAGSLQVHARSFVSPDPFGFGFSVELVVMVVVGGAGSVWGPVAGAGLFTFLEQFLQKTGERVPYVDDLDTVLFGALLIVVIVFCQQGLVSLRVGQWRWLRTATRGEMESG